MDAVSDWGENRVLRELPLRLWNADSLSSSSGPWGKGIERSVWEARYGK